MPSTYQNALYLFKNALDLLEPSNMSTDNPYQSPTYDTADYNELMQRESNEKFSVIDLFFSFQGRMTRLMYWLINLGGTFAYVALAVAIIVTYGPENEMGGTIALILYIPFGVSMFAAQIKRWHDRNKSGWWWVVGMIPMIGPLWVFIECGCLPGTEGTNEYGDMPTV
jgi:uncharacterized membrane protein YhaH (DUF805 family)